MISWQTSPLGLVLAVLLVSTAIQISCCGSSSNQLIVETDEGPRSFVVEIASSPEERRMGLMGRRELEPDHGMLFVFPSLSLSSFWMKDTPISLDIIFIGENKKILQISPDATPFSLERINPDQPYLYVLELAGGTAATSGLQVGNPITLPSNLE